MIEGDEKETTELTEEELLTREYLAMVSRCYCIHWGLMLLYLLETRSILNSHCQLALAQCELTKCELKRGVSNLWNGLWNGLMEWTDGMEYRLTKIAKTHYHGRGEVVSTVLPLLAQLDCYVQPLFSSLVPRPTRGMFCMWTMLFGMFCMWTMLCLAWITLSMVLAAWMPGDVCVNQNEPKFAAPNYGPAFG